MPISGAAASAAYCGELEEIFDDGTNNNYGEWKIKSRFKLRSWDLWKYIEGPESEPPVIPALAETVARRGSSTDDSGHTKTLHVQGSSAEEHKQKTEESGGEPWMAANNLALAKIVCAVPGAQMHLVEDAKYAKQAWESLRSYYQPGGVFRAQAIRSNIVTYRCTPDMDVARWLNDMQGLYSSLRDVDTMGFSDQAFALAILDNMPRDDGWFGLVSNWQTEFLLRESGPVNLAEVITAIREECWWRNRDNCQTYLSSARADADRKKAQKCSRAPYNASPC
jgi:hypothetical protein